MSRMRGPRQGSPVPCQQKKIFFKLAQCRIDRKWGQTLGYSIMPMGLFFVCVLYVCFNLYNILISTPKQIILFFIQNCPRKRVTKATKWNMFLQTQLLRKLK